MVSIGSNLENPSKITLNRLQKELVEWHVNPPTGFNHKATDNIQRWVIEVTGALGTLYANVKCPVFCGISSKLWVVGTVFTHHQKCVIMDTQATGNNKKKAAFIGGLDLCDGRYDTPEHRLFCDLDTVFSGDFHNPTFPVMYYSRRTAKTFAKRRSSKHYSIFPMAPQKVLGKWYGCVEDVLKVLPNRL